MYKYNLLFEDLLELELLVLVEKALASFRPVASRSVPLIVVVILSVLIIRVVLSIIIIVFRPIRRFVFTIRLLLFSTTRHFQNIIN